MCSVNWVPGIPYVSEICNKPKYAYAHFFSRKVIKQSQHVTVHVCFSSIHITIYCSVSSHRQETTEDTIQTGSIFGQHSGKTITGLRSRHLHFAFCRVERRHFVATCSRSDAAQSPFGRVGTLDRVRVFVEGHSLIWLIRSCRTLGEFQVSSQALLLFLHSAHKYILLCCFLLSLQSCPSHLGLIHEHPAPSQVLGGDHSVLQPTRRLPGDRWHYTPPIS